MTIHDRAAAALAALPFDARAATERAFNSACDRAARVSRSDVSEDDAEYGQHGLLDCNRGVLDLMIADWNTPTDDSEAQ